jgi:hypothetical protein
LQSSDLLLIFVISILFVLKLHVFTELSEFSGQFDGLLRIFFEAARSLEPAAADA